MNVATKQRIVVLGMMSRIPVPGVVWQTMHYLLGLRALGFDVYYVEDNGMTPRAFFTDGQSDGWVRAADFVAGVMREFDFTDRWAIRAEHAERRHYGLSSTELAALYRSAALIINLHGNAVPRPEHTASGLLVLLETDPVELQVQLHDGSSRAGEYLAAHQAFFTFGENYGRPGCRLPEADGVQFRPTRQPVVLGLWEGLDSAPRPVFTTIGNWHQSHRQVVLDGETYHWSKDREFERFLDLPARSGARFELALASCDDAARARLEDHGWQLHAPFIDPSTRHDYQRFIASSAGEFTVAKDQNVRLRTGWFSDRSATYLAAGRAVVTQDTGFGDNLPTGKGLFAVTDLEEAAEAIAEVSGNWRLHSAAATELARSHFDADIVLGEMLDTLGLRRARRSRSRVQFGLPAELDVHTVSRWPTRILDASVATVHGLMQDRRRQAAPHAPAPLVESPVASVVIPVKDNVVFTAMCLESLLAESGAPTFEVIVVDNGSTDSTAAHLDAITRLDGRLRVVRCPENLGFAKACNLGIAESRGGIVVLLNNDTIVTPGWLAGLSTHLMADAGVGLVGPVTNHTCNEAQISVGYRTYGELGEFAAARSREFSGSATPLSNLAMFCLAGTRRTFERIGPLDESFGVGLFEDDDYSTRVLAQGLRLVCADDVFVHHFGEVSIGTELDADEYRSLFDTNRERFESKWQRPWAPHERRADPDYVIACAQVRSVVEATVPRGGTVLMVAKGDDGQLGLADRRAWHFPGDASGAFSGEYPADSGAAIVLLDAQIRAGADHLVLPATAKWWRHHYAGLFSYLETFQGPLLHDDDVCAIWALRPPATRSDQTLLRLVARQSDELARLRDEVAALQDIALEARRAVAEPAPDRSDGLSDTWRALDAFMNEAGATKRTRYLLQRARFRDAVQRVTRRGSTIAFVSHGDDELLGVPERTGWHLPRTPEGQWSPGLPVDSAEAIADIERVITEGADYFALPSPYRWWLEHYTGLAHHLGRHAVTVLDDPELGWVWDLGAEPVTAVGEDRWSLSAVIAEATARLGGIDPTILDWDTGLDLAAQLPELVVFSPPVPAERLPYLAGTVDLIVVRDADGPRLAEAHRIATTGAVRAGVDPVDPAFFPEWHANDEDRT